MNQPFDYSILRPYDAAFPPAVLEAVRRRRSTPDGVQHEVLRTRAAASGMGTHRYPWNEMKLGDWFIIPLGDRTIDEVRSLFKQTERRRDVELTIRQIRVDDQKCVRVCLTYEGPVSELKRSLGFPVPDGTYSEARKKRRMKK